jgi:hypothetical protein
LTPAEVLFLGTLCYRLKRFCSLKEKNVQVSTQFRQAKGLRYATEWCEEWAATDRICSVSGITRTRPSSARIGGRLYAVYGPIIIQHEAPGYAHF